MNVQYSPIDLIKKISQNNYSFTGSYTKKMTETNTSVEKLQDKTETFSKKIKALKRYTSGGISKDLLSTQVEEFVKSYNSMKSSSDKVSDKDVQKQITKLEKLFSDNEKSLKKIGIEKVNGKYTFDGDTFEDASDKHINTVLVGHDSFIGQADKIMRKVDEAADGARYDVTDLKLNRTLQYKDTDIVLAANMTLAGQTVSNLKAFDSLVQSGNTSDAEVQTAMKTLLELFAKSVYQTDTATENKDIDQLNQLCLSNEEKLAKVGLVFANNKKDLVFEASTDMTSNDFKTAYHELFGQNALFANAVSDHCKNIFNDIIQPDKLGISIIDQYA